MIKYIGKKHLNSNFYKQISLVQNNDFIKINAVFNERFKNVSTLKLDAIAITDQIEGLSEYDKVKEIVLYFLRNNTICEISQLKDKVVVSSTSFRKLIFRLSNEYQELLNIVIEKYKNDRLKYIEKSNINDVYIQTVYLDKFNIVSETTNYYSGIDKDRELLVLTLATKTDIAPFDKKFIIEYISSMINSSEENIVYYIDETGGHLRCCGKSIRIPRELAKEFWILVMNRNYKISKMNEKQYKLEGIKWKI